MKANRPLILTLFGLALASQVLAGNDVPSTPVSAKYEQKNNIHGTVSDCRSGEPLAGVMVELDGTQQKVYTDLDGKFTFGPMDAGQYKLILSLISYKPSLIEDVMVNPEEKQNIDLKLLPEN